jgi:tRNA(adenine34) deaminase
MPGNREKLAAFANFAQRCLDDCLRSKQGILLNDPMRGTRGAAKRMTAGKDRWIAKVKTDSTHPPAGLFTRSAATIARTLASKKVSPKGPASGMRMLTYFINRAGRGLSRARRAELEKAKLLLSRRIHPEENPTRRKPAA